MEEVVYLSQNDWCPCWYLQLCTSVAVVKHNWQVDSLFSSGLMHQVKKKNPCVIHRTASMDGASVQPCDLNNHLLLDFDLEQKFRPIYYFSL